MKKKILLLLVVLAVSVCVLCACTQDANLLKIGENDSFSYTDLTSLKNDWTLVTDSTYALSDVFNVADSDENVLTINTTASGWARMEQKVNPKANKYYLVLYH